MPKAFIFVLIALIAAFAAASITMDEVLRYNPRALDLSSGAQKDLIKAIMLGEVFTEQADLEETYLDVYDEEAEYELQAGQYTVKSGDTLSGIGAKYGCMLEIITNYRNFVLRACLPIHWS